MAKIRKPTTDEVDLFRKAAADARPLVDDRVHHRPPARAARAVRAPAEPRRWTLPEPGESHPPERGDLVDFGRPGVQSRLRRQLRRGRIPPQDELDLHGMTAGHAARALERFLAEARDRGLRCVRVIHGKGAGSPGGRPTLKRHVDGWLRADGRVLAFASTLPRDGGTGAVYVLLRAAGD